MRRRAVLALAPALLVLPACTGSGDATPPDEAMQTALEKLESAGALHIDLQGSAVPEGRNGVTKAVGDGVVDKTEPAFAGEVTGVIQGKPAGVKIIAIDDKTWMSLFTKEYNPIDMKTLGAPNPAEIFRPGGGVGQILSESTDVVAGEETREGKVVLRSYTGTIPAKPIQDLFLLGKTADTFDVTYGIEPESGELRRAEITGEFYQGEDSTFTVTLSDYGKSVTIDPPTTSSR